MHNVRIFLLKEARDRLFGTPAPRPGTAARDEAMQSLYRLGWGAVALAKLHGLTLEEARAIVRKPPRPRLTPEDRAEIARQFEAGATKGELAERFGCSKSTVAGAIRAARHAKKEISHGEETR
jgi:hypothetical protein